MSRLELKENLKKFAVTESCPVRNIIARFSGKWSILILCILDRNDATRFSEINKALPDISPKVLTDTLKLLEADSLIARKVYAEVPPKVEYSLTATGKSLMPLLYGLIEWAQANSDNILSNRKRR